MKINNEKLKELTGLDFNKIDDNFVFYVQGVLDNLKNNNKNYTREQKERINILYNIFNCIEF